MALTQVKSDGIATGAVTATQIATGAVTANDLEDSGVTAGTYGSSSAIPAITVDAKGRITSASTNSVTQVGGANGVTFNDDVKIQLGTGNDLQIFHDPDHSHIREVGAGTLRLEASEVGILNPTGVETMAQFVADGAVSLRHNNVEKFATTSTGINVTGTVTCDGLTCDGAATIAAGTGELFLRDNDDVGNNAATSVLRGQDSSGSNRWWIGDTSSGNTYLEVWNAQAGPVVFGTNNTNRAYFHGTDGHFLPWTNNTYDLGSASNRWRNVYTNDLNLSNEGGSNDVDGTWGSWTIQEGEDDLFLLNRRNGKKYKFNLSEVN